MICPQNKNKNKKKKQLIYENPERDENPEMDENPGMDENPEIFLTKIYILPQCGIYETSSRISPKRV